MIYLQYIFYSSLIIAVLTGFYWVFLRRETFYAWNRWVLLGGLLVALVYPLIPVPDSLVLLKQGIEEAIIPEELPDENVETRPLELLADEETQLVPNPDLADPIVATPSIEWQLMLFWMYIVGLVLLLFRLIVQLFGLGLQLRKAKVTKGKQYHLASLEADTAPFSFGKYIFLNPNQYNEAEFVQILQHEKIHVRLQHTFDLILAELLTIIQWFNPMAWLYRYLTVENLEFQVDEKILASGEDKKNYQYHLLKIAIPNYPLSITTNYNQSLIKKRITMMNQKKSSLSVVSKYALLLPVLFISLVAFREASPQRDTSAPYERVYVFVSDRATQEELRTLQEELRQDGFSLQFKDLKFEGKLIKEALVVFVEGEEVLGVSQFERGEVEQFLFFSRERDLDQHGTGFSQATIQRILELDANDRVYSAGASSSAYIASVMQSALDRFDAIEEQGRDEGELTKTKGSYITSYDKVDQGVFNQVKKEVLDTKGKVTYTVDGLPWEASEVWNLEPKEVQKMVVGHIQYQEKDRQGNVVSSSPWDLEIKISRAFPEEEETNLSKGTYCIMTARVTERDLKKMQEELERRGINFYINNKNFNDGYLTQISFDWEGRKGHHSNGSYTFDDPSSKVYFYVGNNRKGNQITGNGSRSKNTQVWVQGEQMPASVRRAIESTNSGYKIGSF